MCDNVFVFKRLRCMCVLIAFCFVFKKFTVCVCDNVFGLFSRRLLCVCI